LGNTFLPLNPLVLKLQPIEAVNPVALGLARAKQYTLLKSPQYATNPSCNLGDKVMSVQIHGDASFAGQGIVMESFGLSKVPHLKPLKAFLISSYENRQLAALYKRWICSFNCQVSP